LEADEILFACEQSIMVRLLDKLRELL